MRINSEAGTQLATLDDSDAGEGLAIFFSQGGESVVRYRFVVFARIDGGLYRVGEFYSSVPLATPIPGALTRMIAGAVCPGAIGWSVEVTAIWTLEGDDQEPVIVSETADIVLASSKCFAQIGLTRVAERYNYDSGNGTASFVVLAGMKVTGIAAIGHAGGGNFVIGSGSVVEVPANAGANLSPETSIAPNTVISFTDCDWVVEYLESA